MKNNKKKIISLNKQLDKFFKDIKSLPTNDINKILFNIELFKNKYLIRRNIKDTNLYESVNVRSIINYLKL